MKVKVEIMQRHVVTCVDYGDSCDGQARVLGMFPTEDAAKEYVSADMHDRIKENASLKDRGKLSLWDDNHENGCEWNIESIFFN